MHRREPPPTLYQRIYDVVRHIPSGRVATYGQVAVHVHDCSARQVGYALSALPRGSPVPWQRVINREGRISGRKSGSGAVRQRRLLEAEGVCFDRHGRVEFARYGWDGLAGEAGRAEG